VWSFFMEKAGARLEKSNAARTSAACRRLDGGNTFVAAHSRAATQTSLVTKKTTRKCGLFLWRKRVRGSKNPMRRGRAPLAAGLYGGNTFVAAPYKAQHPALRRYRFWKEKC
jgi:hypothetical protein